MTELTKKVAVITGAACGIGRACAEDFARRGARVVVSDLPDSDGEKVVAAILEQGGEAIFIACDVSVAGEVEDLMGRTVDHFGALHIGVNNAGIGGEQAPLAEYPIDAWKKVMDVNLTGPFLCMKYQIPHMLEAGGGSIVNVSSILGQVAFPTAPAYTAAKHGLVGLTRAAALDYAEQNVRVNSVGPAFIDTPMIAPLKEDKEAFAGLVATHPMGRIGKPDEVANLVAFLAGDQASFITGSYYAVDGGYLCR